MERIKQIVRYLLSVASNGAMGFWKKKTRKEDAASLAQREADEDIRLMAEELRRLYLQDQRQQRRNKLQEYFNDKFNEIISRTIDIVVITFILWIAAGAATYLGVVISLAIIVFILGEAPDYMELTKEQEHVVEQLFNMTMITLMTFAIIYLTAPIFGW
jgi:hypothetical protein